jgi:hypothetical protein
MKNLSRTELINHIWENSAEEFESKQEVLEIAKESKKELRKRCISINNYLENQ